MYLVKTPWWLSALYPSLIWRIKGTGKKIYLTFDDGPHETATLFVLEQLRKYKAKATFFCIGKNVAAYPAIYQNILDEGHAVGNHTYHHLNGWKVKNDMYVKDVVEASAIIKSNLFRPPYGRIRRKQQQQLQTSNSQLQTIMWDVLSGDFDTQLRAEKCLENVLKNTRSGSIVVFHDSTKAWERMQYALPKTLAHFAEQGYEFSAIPG
jgi:peptidoglycan/xylan/chitin deacetylase (PgdA/CDA1 family)